MDVVVKTVKIGRIKPSPDNPRRLNERDMERLSKSIENFPEMLDIREIVVDEGMVILGGNMRYQSLKLSGAKEVTVKIVRGLTPEQKREFTIKDNGTYGEWDYEALANAWHDLPLVDFGVKLPTEWFDQNQGKDMGKVEESAYTDKDIQGAKDHAKDSMNQTRELYAVMCPGCGHEFNIEK
jgi:hypothetical protein